MQVFGGRGEGGGVQTGRVGAGGSGQSRGLRASRGADQSLDALPLSLYQSGLLERCLILPQVLGPQLSFMGQAHQAPRA